jgi:enhancing lycopene biosynthesis protein 2
MAKEKKFAVVLSGCGVFDGAEIHEATLSLYSIKKNGASYEVFAPDVPQAHVMNHITGQVMHESRNVMVEAARIARGKIKPLSAFKAEDYDALLFPGGFGAAKNLCTYAFDGPEMKVNGDVEKAIRATIKMAKPIGALCIAPVILARLLGQVELTIGQDPSTAADVEKMGAKHRKTGHGEVVVDRKYKLVTSPCYMLDASIVDIAKGAENTIREMMKLMD